MQALLFLLFADRQLVMLPEITSKPSQLLTVGSTLKVRAVFFTEQYVSGCRTG